MGKRSEIDFARFGKIFEEGYVPEYIRTAGRGLFRSAGFCRMKNRCHFRTAANAVCVINIIVDAGLEFLEKKWGQKLKNNLFPKERILNRFS